DRFILFRWFNAGFEALAHGYAASVRTFIRFRWALVIVFFALTGGAYMLSNRLASTFLPVEDQGYFFVVVQLPDGASLALTDAFALSFDPPSVNGLGATGGFEFQVEDLTGHGAAALNDATQALLAVARTQPELNPQSLFSSFSASTPQFFYDLDRTKAKLLGLSLPDVFNTLQIYLGSLYVNDFNLFGHTFRVTMQADTKSRASPSD